ncbi:MAG: hypothetical protein AAF125_08865 [Chloroflexota bacterium]
MSKRLYLHIGLHKTGTTTIQSALYHNRDVLRAMGVIYPETGLQVNGKSAAHFHIGWSLMDPPPHFYDPARGGYIQLMETIRRASARTFIVSSEGFSHLTPPDIARLRDAIGQDVQPIIVLYLRNPQTWVPSMWSQEVRNGREQRTLSAHIRTRKINNLHTTVGNWASAFGQENMRVRIYDEVAGEALVPDFWNAVDLTVAQQRELRPVDNQNISPTPAFTELVRRINERIDFSQPSIRVRPLLLQFYAWLWPFAAPIRQKYGARPVLSAEDANAIEAIYGPGNREIARDYFNREALFPPRPLPDASTRPINEMQFAEEDLFDLLAFLGEKIIQHELAGDNQQQSAQTVLSQMQQALAQQRATHTRQTEAIRGALAPAVRTAHRATINENFWVARTANQLSNRYRIRQLTRRAQRGTLHIPMLFEPDWYLDTYPEVADAPMPPYVHFVIFGWVQGLLPMPLFDVDWYITTYPRSYASDYSPLAFYEAEGQHRGECPNAVFDPLWYLETYADVRAAGLDPLWHYRHGGWKEGRNASADFNTRDYLASHPAVRGNPVAHDIRVRAAQRMGYK